MRERIRNSIEYIRSRSAIVPELGIVLGTGLNSVADIAQEVVEIPYAEIPGFGISTAPSHAGRLLLGRIAEKQVAIMQGRLHYYEGFSLQEVTFPIRVLTALGINTLFLTNAAGSLNPFFLPGELVLVKDHINFMGNNPLIGKNDEALGERFPSLHNPYDAKLRKQVIEIGRRNNFNILEGVYVAVTGPSLETRAECLMLRNLGADLVGMSTVPEVIVAIHGGVRVLVLSAVTNLSNIFHSQPHTQEEIRYYAAKNKEKLAMIIKEIDLKI